MLSHNRKIGHRSQKHAFRPLVEELESRLTPSSFASTNYFHVRPLAGGVGPGGGYSPLQVLEAYNFDSPGGTNNISFNGVAGNGAGQTIAIVDAYNDPNIASDLAAFDTQFNLPQLNLSAGPSFKVVNQNGQTTSLPAANSGWAVEESLDVEWAHAIAPGANIVLVEASSSSFANLDSAVTTAANMTGVSVVSMSWSGGESSSETSLDSIFTHTGVTYLAATGDDGSPAGYPAYSANVVAVGGTTLNINTNGTTYSYGSETGWSGSGGGASVYEPEPSYQQLVQTTGERMAPDVAFLADPNTGVSIYDSYHNPYGGPWTVVGGTSLATPSWAAIVSIINQGRVAAGGSALNSTPTTQTLPGLYSLRSTDFHDNLGGSNGTSTSGLVNPAIYNEVTGLGSPTTSLISDMVAYGNASSPHLVITTAPPNSSAGAAFGFTATVELGATTDTNYSGTATVSLLNNPGGSTLSVASGSSFTVNIVNGAATFSGLSLNKVGTSYTLSVSATGLSPVSTPAFNVTPGSAAQIVVKTQPPASVAQNAAFTVAFAIEDAYGNVLTADNTDSVTLSFANDAGSATLGGSTTNVSVVDGVATFSNLTVNSPGAGYTLQAQFTPQGQSTPIVSVPTNPFTVNPASQATQLVFTTEPPSTVRDDTAFIVNVSVENAAGQVVTGYTGTVTIAIAGDPAGGSVTVTVVNGVASFDLDLSGTGTLSLLATSQGLTSATSTPITLMRR
jgi:subtilase family serine protease